MQFSRDGDWYLVARITGPTRNLLGIRFGDHSAPLPVVERLTIKNETPLIDADDVQRQVLEGVAHANARLGTDYSVAAMRFVVSDSPSPSVYHFLAEVIVQRAYEGPPETT